MDWCHVFEIATSMGTKSSKQQANESKGIEEQLRLFDAMVPTVQKCQDTKKLDMPAHDSEGEELWYTRSPLRRRSIPIPTSFAKAAGINEPSNVPTHIR